jgi:2-isopropylmalate synthase
VAYLPIDPRDIGRTYQEVIRINSQSGKGGVAYVLQRDYGYELPRWLQVDFSQAVQKLAEQSESEVASQDIHRLFEATYLRGGADWELGSYQLARDEGEDALTATLKTPTGETSLSGRGNGVIDAFVNGLEAHFGRRIVVVEYSEHTLGQSADAEAVCYVQLNVDGERPCGVGRSHDIVQATVNAILSALVAVDVGASVAA